VEVRGENGGGGGEGHTPTEDSCGLRAHGAAPAFARTSIFTVQSSKASDFVRKAAPMVVSTSSKNSLQRAGWAEAEM
jgi:hypothetical protein